MDWSKPYVPAKYRKLYEQGRAGKEIGRAHV